MSFMLALKAFWKALKDPRSAKHYLEGTAATPQQAPTSSTQSDLSHIRLLAQLQQAGRLIDFLKEDISTFSDADVGAAVRKIHQDCAKCIEDLVTVRPVMEESEGASIRVPKGYDPTTLKLIGNISGEPPFNGTLIHKGWKAHKQSLPKQIGLKQTDVICPAEIEIK